NDILKIIDAFLSAGIPYATDGKEDISGERRVKQLLDVLALAHIEGKESEEKDLALYRVLTSDYFELSHADILRFLRHVNSRKTESPGGGVTFLEEFLRYFSSSDSAVKMERPDKIMRAADCIQKLLTDSSARSVHSILMNFVKNSGLFRYILKAYADNKILKIRELRSLGSFINMVKTSDMARPSLRLGEFMAEMKTRKDHGLPIEGSLVTLTQTGVRVYTAHGSKGLEFHSVIIPFCLQNKNWPAKIIPDRIQFPFDLFRTKGKLNEKSILKQLALQDETRLFYVAITRARANLVFTASPSEDSVSSYYLNGLDISGDNAEEGAEEDVISKSLDQTDLEDPFIGSEEILQDMIRDLTLNPTRLNNYIACPRKFLYNDVVKLPGAKKKSLVFGNCVHKALERTYGQYMDRRVFPPFKFFEKTFRTELIFQGADKDMARDCLNKMKTVKEWFDKSAKEAVAPISLEKKLLATIGENIIFTGKYDKVEWVDEL
ncbi:MAG: 3'-5' exonuclease, partial [Candidatus Omnitrophota bacterium]|nr:3'-5' exonuclease [Candidatus Omnitrophota bacterium]